MSPHGCGGLSLADSALYTMTSRYSKPDALAILCNAHGEVFRANACGFSDDALHFLCSTNIWLASGWCVCWLHLLQVSCFRPIPVSGMPALRDCCDMRTLSFSFSLSRSIVLSRALSLSISLPPSLLPSLPLMLSLSLFWLGDWVGVCVRERDRE